MDNLKAFFAESAIKVEEKEYVASERFVDADRKPIAWKIRSLDASQCEGILNLCKRKEFVPGSRETKVVTDNQKFILTMITSCVTFPNLNDSALQDSWGVNNAGDLIRKMLTPGEYADLANTVQQVNGYDVGMQDKIQRAKN